MEKHIILLNGSSSSGKSTLAKVLQTVIEDKRNERYDIVSIDDFLEMTTEEVIYETHSAPMKTEIVYPLNAKESIKDNRRKIAELSARLTALEAQLTK